jgi:hypothetical protein
MRIRQPNAGGTHGDRQEAQETHPQNFEAQGRARQGQARAGLEGEGEG